MMNERFKSNRPKINKIKSKVNSIEQIIMFHLDVGSCNIAP